MSHNINAIINDKNNPKLFSFQIFSRSWYSITNYQDIYNRIRRCVASKRQHTHILLHTHIITYVYICFIVIICPTGLLYASWLKFLTANKYFWMASTTPTKFTIELFLPPLYSLYPFGHNQ